MAPKSELCAGRSYACDGLAGAQPTGWQTCISCRLCRMTVNVGCGYLIPRDLVEGLLSAVKQSHLCSTLRVLCGSLVRVRQCPFCGNHFVAGYDRSGLSTVRLADKFPAIERQFYDVKPSLYSSNLLVRCRSIVLKLANHQGLLPGSL